MKRIIINTSVTSEILIGNKINIHDEIVGYNKVLLISDTNVFKIYGGSVIAQLIKSNKSIFKFVVSAGEKSKNIKTALEIIKCVSDNNFSRNDVVVTLGGGVISDLGGFAASIYKRGIKVYHVPTTILGAVDASIGGKTGVNTEYGKNILGTFYNAVKTIIDISYFSTLPYKEINCGKSEILKYAFISNPGILNFIKSNDLENTIKECIEVKKIFIESDSLDLGKRMILNFGHTIGHAIERYSNYAINHGEAISVGMATMSRYFKVREIENILKENNLPITFDANSEDLMEFIKLDKKRMGDVYNIVIPLKPGECKIEQVNENEIIDILKRMKG